MAAAGSGPVSGMAVGGALALKHERTRLPDRRILGDGDYLMGVSGLWTAVHHDIPLFDSSSPTTAPSSMTSCTRSVSRSPATGTSTIKGVGIRLDEPDVDLVGMATAQGCVGFGPIHTPDDLRQELILAVEQVKAGKVVVVDARVSRSY